MQFHCINGQTATGKTKLALQMAHEAGADIISCDSRQVYRHLSCITGKDVGETHTFSMVQSHNEMTYGYYTVEGVRIWGLDIIDPNTHFSSSDFVDYVTRVYSLITIDSTVAPIIVGGTYLYLQDVLYGTSAHVPQNTQLREEFKDASVDHIQNTLKGLDPSALESMNHSDRHNPRRLIRRIEIASSEQPTNNAREAATVLSYTGLRHATPELLESRIRQRVEARLRDCALQEIQHLLTLGYSEQDPGCTATGCKHLFALQRGDISREEAIELWIRDEVQYAKRQWTFMKRNMGIQWIAV